MVLPTNYLAAYPIPISTLDSISKLIIKFLLSKGGNRNGIPLVSWNRITLKKSGERLGSEIFFVKTSLMIKDSINYLNNKHVIWISLLNLK